MIQTFDNHLIISELDRTKLPTYWNGYLFTYSTYFK